MAGKLIAHCGATLMDREGLQALETPPPTDSWTPIPHYELVQALDGQLRARGINIVKESFAIQKAKLFGVIDTDYQVAEEGGAAIGIRTSNDKLSVSEILSVTTWPLRVISSHSGGSTQGILICIRNLPRGLLGMCGTIAGCRTTSASGRKRRLPLNAPKP